MTEPCGQRETIGEIKATLGFFKDAEERREAREERMLRAMEDIAAHGATILNLDKRTTKVENDVTEAFGVIRVLHQSSATTEELEKVKCRVTKIEFRHAKETGAEVVEAQRSKFWDGVIKQCTPYAVSGFLFIIYLIDRFNVAQWVAKLWKQKG